MKRIEQLRNQIEIERNKLNDVIDNNKDLQKSYKQNVALDKLIEQYIEELEMVKA